MHYGINLKNIITISIKKQSSSFPLSLCRCFYQQKNLIIKKCSSIHFPQKGIPYTQAKRIDSDINFMGFIVLENIRKAQTEIIFIFRRLAAERQRQKSKIVHLQALFYHFDWLDSFASFLIFFYTLRKSFV